MLQFTPLKLNYLLYGLLLWGEFRAFLAANAILVFIFNSMKYPWLLGGQRQHGRGALTNTSTHGWELVLHTGQWRTCAITNPSTNLALHCLNSVIWRGQVTARPSTTIYVGDDFSAILVTDFWAFSTSGTVLPWSGGRECEPRSGWTWGAWCFCPKSHLNQKYQLPVHQTIWEPVHLKSPQTSKIMWQYISFLKEVTDGLVVRAGVSVTWTVLS